MSGENNDIIVQGWSERYAVAGRALLGIEGGHVNDPVDRGGETKFGVSLRFLVAEGQIDLDGDGIADFDLDMDGDIDGADIRKLKRGDALYLFHRCFWLRLDADSFAPPIGEMLFDQAVNGGLTAARKMLQRAVNASLVTYGLNGQALVIDGVLGTATRAMIDRVLQWNGAGLPTLINAYRDVVADRYRAIVAANPSQKRFLNGWLNRAAQLGRA
jgi:lysozyme family protein